MSAQFHPFITQVTNKTWIKWMLVMDTIAHQDYVIMLVKISKLI